MTTARELRVKRMEELIAESSEILRNGIDQHITSQGKEVAAIVGLFSGGKDSTLLCHLMLPHITHLGHANTTIGIEQTRQYVRDTAVLWGKPLLEYKPERESDHYEALVLDHGFPGAGHHFKMYQRLKERSLRRIQRELVSKGHRVVFLAGRRRDESQRRLNVPESERVGSAVWISPLVNWTTADMNTYRLTHDVPINEVSDLLHMSGECLCGSFAHAGELDEIAEWFPDVVATIRNLEDRIKDRDDIPEQRRKWGWGAESGEKRSKVGRLCSTCDARWVSETLI